MFDRGYVLRRESLHRSLADGRLATPMKIEKAVLRKLPPGLRPEYISASWNQPASKLAEAFAITCGKKIEITTNTAATHNRSEAITLGRRRHFFAREAS
jgi:hypothetical protein